MSLQVQTLCALAALVGSAADRRTVRARGAQRSSGCRLARLLQLGSVRLPAIERHLRAPRATRAHARLLRRCAIQHVQSMSSSIQISNITLL